jgi:hypothetical protein
VKQFSATLGVRRHNAGGYFQPTFCRRPDEGGQSLQLLRCKFKARHATADVVLMRVFQVVEQGSVAELVGSKVE